MSNGTNRLTPDIAQTICAYIRQGGFPHIAAEAAGIPVEVFQSWLAKGRSKRAKNPYRSFAAEVRQALAQARVLAEMGTWKASPVIWLLKGQGKDAAGNPGWSRETDPVIVEENDTVNVFASPEWASVLVTIQHALASFPEARVALAQALKESQ
jgi:hypothetical protein